MLRYFGFSYRSIKTIEAILAFFALVGLLNIFSWLDYSVPIHVVARVFPDLSIAAGKNLVYDNRFTRDRFCEAVVDRWFIGNDGARRDIEPVEQPMATRGLNVLNVSRAEIEVPLLPDGPSKFCFQSHWMCNPLQKYVRSIDGPLTCLDFIVVKPKRDMSQSPWHLLLDPSPVSARIYADDEF